MITAPLRILPARDLPASTQAGALDAETLSAAQAIINVMRAEGEPAVRRYAQRFDNLAPNAPLVLDRAAMNAARERLDTSDRAVLERCAQRVRAFADAQRAALQPMTTSIPGGRAGHTLEPIESAACYAPGGRYPLPSTILMTAVTARAAGCKRVVVVSPRADDMMLAAAAIAGADEFIPLGGAHAIAALAYGAGPITPTDIIVGPGNRWVTAAKKLVAGDVAIDMLAGPSELLVLADDSADPALIAADLLAQAEHDDDARPFLITTSADVARAVNAALLAQVEDLPTRDTAMRALANGAIGLADTLDDAIAAANRLAVEHLEIHCRNANAVAQRIRHAGAVFIGPRSAEVFGDYCFGPNHTLPTGGAARQSGGLSVATFLRLRTWMEVDEQPDPAAMADARRLAELEGLTAHARAIAARAVTSVV